MNETSYLFSLVMGLILGVLTAMLAVRKGKNPYLWFFLGFLLGILGLLVLFFWPPMGFNPPTAANKEEEGTTSHPPPAPPPPDGAAPPLDPLSLASEEWYYLDDSWQPQGPVSLEYLQEAWRQKKLDPQSFVWAPSLHEWTKVAALPQFQD